MSFEAVLYAQGLRPASFQFFVLVCLSHSATITMYKSRLQEVCQKKSWALPRYSTTRDGPDHNPCFKASVIVNGVQYKTPEFCRSSKEAQNEAAKIAFDTLSLPALQQTSMIPGRFELKSQNSLQSSLSSSIALEHDLLQSDVLSSTSYQLANVPREEIKSTKGSITESSTNPTSLDQLLENLNLGDGKKLGGLPSTSYQLANVQREEIKSTKGSITESSTKPTSLDQLLESLNLGDGKKSVCLPSTYQLANVQREEIKSTKGSITESLTNPTSLDQLPENLNLVDDMHSYKSKLAMALQKRSLKPAIYSSVREGQSHAPRFKATVTVNDTSFESPVFYRTLREAENAAAKVAVLSLSSEGIQEDESGIYKSLLQQMVQKEGLSLPIYNATKSGASHLPAFTSTVEIEGEIFHGEVAKTKKRAEMNAAKIALAALKERRQSQNVAGPSLISKTQEALSRRASGSRSIITVDLLPQNPRSNCGQSNYRDNNDDGNDDAFNIDDKGCISETGISPSEGKPITKLNIETLQKGEGSSSSNLYVRLRDPILPDPFTTKESTQSPSPPCHSDEGSIGSGGNPFSDHSSPVSKHVGPSSSLKIGNRVQVFPRSANMVVPEGATLFPFSDDKRVAFTIDYPGQEAE